MKIKNCKIKNCQGGYTIIEMMIALSVFLVIIMTGIGALLNANLLHQKSRDMRSLMDNLSFIMEDMSRNLRTGSSFRCLVEGDDLSDVAVPFSCPIGKWGWGVAFEAGGGDPADDDEQWVYYIGLDMDDPAQPMAIWRATAAPYVFSSFVKLTPDEVKIDALASGFLVSGAEPWPDTEQPFVTIKLVGTISFKGVDTPFSLQTSVSQRLIDI